MEDRGLLEATLNAVGALAYRLTGERLVLCVRDEDGSISHVYPNDSQVTWVKSPGVGVAEGRTVDTQALGEMRCSLHD